MTLGKKLPLKRTFRIFKGIVASYFERYFLNEYFFVNCEN